MDIFDILAARANKQSKKNEQDIRSVEEKLVGAEQGFADRAEALETTYAPRLTGVETHLADIATDFDNVIANATTDSEVIISRGNHTTLGNRLDHIEDNSADKVKVASIEKDLKSYQNVLASVNVNQEAKQSVTGYGVVSLPKNCANGQVSVGLKGQSIFQYADNGVNYANWVLDANITKDSTGLLFSGDGTTNDSYLPINLNSGTQYTVVFNVVSTNYATGDNKFSIKAYNGVLDSNVNIGNLCQTLGRKRVLITTSSTITTNNLVFGATGNMLNGESVKIADIVVLEGDWTNKDLPFSGGLTYGTKSTISASRLKSVGKNLFDGKLELGKISTTTGINESDATRIRSVGYTRVSPNTSYKASINGVEKTTVIVFYDNNKNFISFGNATSGNIVTPSNCYFVRHYHASTDVAEKFQLEQNTVATPYEPYTESTSYLPNVGELRSLPNGVRDEIRVSGGKAELVKRNNKHILQASDVIYLLKTNTNNDVVYVKKPLDYIGYNNATSHANTVLLNGFTMVYKGVLDALDNINNIHNNQMVDRFYITLPKDVYVDLADAKSKLTGLELTYQLAEPIITPIDVSGTLLSYSSGTVYAEKAVADVGVYSSGLSVLNQGLPIKEIETISKVDFTTGLETKLDVSNAVINADKLSFTHPNLVENDIVFFTYFYEKEGTQGELTLEYYDSRHTVKDKTLANKFYQWKIEVDNGVPSIKLVEV